MEKRNFYKADLRDFEFLLWEQFPKFAEILAHPRYSKCSDADISTILQRGQTFAYQHLGPSYQSSDEQGCQLIDGSVQLPREYPELWQRFQQDWGDLANDDRDDASPLPPMVMQMLLEMFMGAHPSFMTYGGFCLPSATLLERYGSALQQQLFKHKLATSQWTSCLALTEPQAGSDVSLVKTRGSRQEDGTYLLQGEKYLISAGMHDLTDNTVYFVLGRGEQSGDGTFGLSCFIVPKYWVEEDGTQGEFNHVECVALADKMGFKGCANTHLTFGKNGPCRAYLMGERENVGLLQFLTLMNQARISTGVYALGMASSAYLNALHYSSTRLQGKRFQESFNPRADRVNIIEHADVQRMLLEMKSKVEGCRALIARLTLSESYLSIYQQDVDKEQECTHHQGLMNLLTPVVKAYISDQAWRICELAIQTCGGQGYLKHTGIEQYARDIKVLSIWEGTNFIQSQDLIRDKLGMGNQSKLYRIYQQQVDATLARASDFPALKPLVEQLTLSYQHLDQCLQQVGQWVKSKQLERIPTFSTRILHLMGDVTIGWLLLDGAMAATSALTQADKKHSDAFYRGKLHSAQYFILNELPRSAFTLAVVSNDDASHTMASEQWQDLIAGVNG
ncbi:acyl-CoA dehydrogenase [Bacterioplanes sanyensis]|nr:acyl-CoA dehydrogenase [Bacterioplanes sanyensis]